MTTTEREIMIYAFRYALGRTSCAPATMVSYIQDSWEKLEETTKSTIKSEIQGAIDAGMAGMAMDEREWTKILDLE